MIFGFSTMSILCLLEILEGLEIFKRFPKLFLKD